MEYAAKAEAMAAQDRRISEAFERERTRLWNFVRRRVANESDAEDVLQDVFAELVDAERLMQPLQEIGAWLFRVARNRIIDRFRRQATRREQDITRASGEADGPLTLDDLIPSGDAGPEAAYARELLLEEMEAALAELPAEQRDVFVAHELEGRSFNDLAAETGVPLNTLLSRKRYSVLYLRRRLRAIYDEFVQP